MIFHFVRSNHIIYSISILKVISFKQKLIKQNPSSMVKFFEWKRNLIIFFFHAHTKAIAKQKQIFFCNLIIMSLSFLLRNRYGNVYHSILKTIILFDVTHNSCIIFCPLISTLDLSKRFVLVSTIPKVQERKFVWECMLMMQVNYFDMIFLIEKCWWSHLKIKAEKLIEYLSLRSGW